MSPQLVLWRHGRTAWNLDGRTQGQSDTDLDDVGVAQAADAAGRLASLDPVALVSSDLRRAVDTAAALARRTGLVPTYDARLREVDFGVREGLTVDEAREKWPAEMARRDAGEDVRFPEAETIAEAARRCAAALHDIAASLDDTGTDTVVAVGHGSALRAGACLFLGLPQQHWARFGALANCRWAVLGGNARGWRIEEWNASSLPPVVVGAG